MNGWVTLRILIVAPTLAGISDSEIPTVASGNRPTILHGLVTADYLEAVLRSEQFEVIHFMQHGSYGVLQMSDALINEDQLVRILKRQEGLRLIFVNACNSAGTAARLHNELHCTTVAHEAPINDRLAVTYAREFYKTLAEHFDPHAADEAAYSVLVMEARNMGITDYVKPVLTNGDMVTLQALSVAVGHLRDEQATLQRTVHELVKWLRVVMPAALGIIAILVALAYWAPR